MRGHRQLRRTAGFSLIELLIVVAIIAALVGVAVPMFQKNIAEAHRAKANQDLDTIRNAITLHDSQNKPLIGTDLKPLLGRYLQEIPKDPWGNDYLLDAGMVMLISFGADQKAGGQDEDKDLEIRYKSQLKIQKAVYTGAWGLPVANSQLRIQFNKPFEVGTASPLDDLVLVVDAKNGGVMPFSGGAVTVTSGTAPDIAWGAVRWVYDATKSDPNNGLAVLLVNPGADTSNPANTVRLSPSMALNIKSTVSSGVTSDGRPISSSTFREKPTKGGPCDKLAYGNEVLAADGAYPQELIGGENRGVAIERLR